LLKKVKELGIDSQILVVSKDSPASKNRFVLYKGNLNIIAPSLYEMIVSPSPVLRGFLKNILMEPFQPKSTTDDESVESFMTRRLGKFASENLFSALVSGVYADDYRKLSIRSAFPSLWQMEKECGSIVLGAIKSMLSFKKAKAENPANQEFIDLVCSGKMYSFKNGIQTITDALSTKIGSMGVEIISQKATKVQIFNENAQVNTILW
jgi:protoporphyrinogen/coproporphyrinogen III oxidase